MKMRFNVCIAILQKQRSKLTEKQLVNCFDSNKDGIGYSFIQDGQLRTKKFLEFQPFLNDYKKDWKTLGNDSKFVVHFRYTTHGKTNLTNVHPFKVNENLVFCHNGIIGNLATSKEYSDTFIFNETILKKYKHNFLKDKKLLKKLNRKYLSSSKLVFLNNQNEHKIVNEENGIWENGIWFSNDSFRNKIVWVTKTNGWIKQDSKPCDECKVTTDEDCLVDIGFTNYDGRYVEKQVCFRCVDVTLYREHIEYGEGEENYLNSQFD